MSLQSLEPHKDGGDYESAEGTEASQNIGTCRCSRGGYSARSDLAHGMEEAKSRLG